MTVTGAASGHPSIRATHRKTLELAREDEISERATCVVGVGARLDEAALADLHGFVRLTLSVGGRSETVGGRLNPAFRPGDPLVVRRATAVTRDALVIGADRAACDLARSFVASLADATARIAVTVEPAAGAVAPGVLVVQPSPPGGVGRIDSAIRGQNDPRSGEPGVEGVEGVAEALAAGRRVVLEADLGGDPTAREAIQAAHDAGHTVLPAAGLPVAEAVRAIGGSPPDAEVVEDVPAESLARRLRGAERAAIVLDPGTPREEYVGWRAGRPLEIPGARGRRAAYAVVRGEAAAGGEAAGAASLARARSLAAGGASTRDVARALREDARLPRRRAYELALELTADTSSVSRPEPRTSR
jgi:hypothetical protein